MKARACIVGLVGAILVLAARPRSQSNEATRLFADYAAGDRFAVARALSTNESYRGMQDDLLRLVATWKNSGVEPAPAGPAPAWDSARAVFAVEVGLTRMSSGAGTSDCLRWMDIARELTATRAIGRSRAITSEDRLEVAIHRVAISAMMAMSAPGFATLYLHNIAGRVDALGRLPEGAALVARLALMRGMLAETSTRPLATDARDVAISAASGGQPVLRLTVDRRSADELSRMQNALSVFTRLAADPEVGAEANVRRALLWHRLGDQSRALDAIDRGLAASQDRIVSYWGWLIRGRILDTMGRPADAVAAFERAAALVPTAQTPATALAALLLIQNDREGAERWAAVARTDRGAGDLRDPWWLYWFGDTRVLDELVDQIRPPRP